MTNSLKPSTRGLIRAFKSINLAKTEGPRSRLKLANGMKATMKQHHRKYRTKAVLRTAASIRKSHGLRGMI